MKKLNINRIILLAIAAPIVVAWLVAGGPAIWSVIVTVVRARVPNIWTVVAYIYFAFIGFLLGLKKGKKNSKN